MRFALPLALFIALGALFSFSLTRDASLIPSPLLDQPLPSFSLPSLADPEETVTEHALAGQPALLNIWGSWCAQCGTEHAFLMELARNGVPIVGLNWNDEQASARAWLERLGDPYVVTAVDVEGRVAIDLGVYGAPETFLVDGGGTIIYKYIGPLTPQVWRDEFMPRLAQLGPGGAGD
ncbi:MAG: DsbE family thiol:disulfide interchange protein [Pseudomonadota bacterium]